MNECSLLYDTDHNHKELLKKKSQNSLTNSSKDITDGLGDVLSKELGW